MWNAQIYSYLLIVLYKSNCFITIKLCIVLLQLRNAFRLQINAQINYWKQHISCLLHRNCDNNRNTKNFVIHSRSTKLISRAYTFYQSLIRQRWGKLLTTVPFLSYSLIIKFFRMFRLLRVFRYSLLTIYQMNAET